MPEQTNTDELVADHGQAFFAWEFPEYIKHERTKTWYWLAGGVDLLLVIWSLFTGNYLFALGLVLLALVIMLHDVREPEMVKFVINEDGVQVGRQFFEYKEIKSFFIIYEPPEVKTLHFKFDAYWRPRLAIPLQNINPLAVREVLLKRLPEDLSVTEEPLSDFISRRWKL
jgi:hypothetical protein